MEPVDVSMTLLSLVGVRLPVLIALAVSLVWAFDAPRGPVRTGALAGLLLLGAANVAGLLLSALPLWLVSMGEFGTVSALGDIVGITRFGLSLLEALGVVLLVWALTRALRALRPAG